ncbi:MAG TPA: hypothetical protein PK024_11595 [Methanospirillum sp.]|uniref:hypothetical protein n=1 Tax=Methanospirillum sp. TaxID=45200 RepID=UPI002C345D0B|nr:hypothetical protein [Methanospirillum sp.]HOJ97464.1 hypothetical protein [Methanospirillum sp.]HPP77927.1 hypothetical protein [Methanospirillum sp.]
MHPYGLSARMVQMMVLHAALLANGVARTRSSDFTVDFATKSAMCVFSCHWCDSTGPPGGYRWFERVGPLKENNPSDMAVLNTRDYKNRNDFIF